MKGRCLFVSGATWVNRRDVEKSNEWSPQLAWMRVGNRVGISFLDEPRLRTVDERAPVAESLRLLQKEN